MSPLGADSSSGGIGGLLRTLKRRQGIFIASTALISGLLAAQTFIERRFNPVFAGNFTLQIESSLFDDQVLGAEGKIATLARSRVRNNIPALSAILSSPLVIAPVAEKMGLQTSDIVSRLNIQSNPNTQAIMNVSLNWKNPEQGRAILENLAKAFVEYSLLQRQSSIDSGMKWLDTQAPSILANVNKYETKLREFREKNLVIDPTENAETIITQRDALVNQVSSLQLEQARLQSQIETVRSGKLSYRPSGAPAPIEQLGRQGTLIPSTASPSGQVLEETVGTTNPSSEYQKYEIELARARAVYRDDSPVVQSILAKRDALAPVAKNQQLGQLTEKLFENVKRQDELNRQILMLNQNFRSSPDKLKEYNNIAQRLEAARTNYASYVSALENFKLEKARFVSPWQVISPPSFNDVPVSPDIRNNLLRALLFGLVGGTIAAVIRERTDNVFHTPTDAEKELQ
ncbi:MAG: GumC family protein, partial [bacterium]